MDNGIFNAIAAMSGIDDGLVSEAAEDIPAKKAGYARYYVPAAAAAALIIAAVTVHSFKKLNDRKQAFVPPADKTETAEATGEPYYTYAHTESDGNMPTGEPTGNATEIIVDSTLTPQATAETTGEPTPTRETTAQPTYHTTSEPGPTGAATSAPVHTEQPTDLPSSAPTASHTPEPTPAPTAAPTFMPTGEPSLVPTAAPTAAAPTQTPEPSAEATSVPYVPEMNFSSIEDFVAAVRYGADPLLDGIDHYYTADMLPAGSRLTGIKVDTDTVTYYYSIAGGGNFQYNWTRDTSYSQSLYNTLLGNYPHGTWHGSLYVFTTIAGYYASASLDEGHLLRTYITIDCTEEQMVSWSMLTRHSI